VGFHGGRGTAEKREKTIKWVGIKILHQRGGNFKKNYSGREPNKSAEDSYLNMGPDVEKRREGVLTRGKVAKAPGGELVPGELGVRSKKNL